jgi:hypothetical protein
MNSFFRTLCCAGRGSAAVAAVLTIACTPADEGRAGPERTPAAATASRDASPPSAVPATKAAAAPAPTPAEPQDAKAFWAEFRTAALSGETAPLLPLVRFPFTTRGQMDEDPVVKHGREEFPGLFAQLLVQHTGLDFGYQQTERELLEETTSLPPQEAELSKTGSFRVGTFVFEREGGAWKLVHAYTEEP